MNETFVIMQHDHTSGASQIWGNRFYESRDLAERRKPQDVIRHITMVEKHGVDPYYPMPLITFKVIQLDRG